MLTNCRDGPGRWKCKNNIEMAIQRQSSEAPCRPGIGEKAGNTVVGMSELQNELSIRINPCPWEAEKVCPVAKIIELRFSGQETD